MNPNGAYKILVVDDEAGIIELLVYNLEKEGYDVQSADNGENAIEKARKFLPNLVIIDIMMPGLDGVETCRRMREIAGLKDAYIIFLTARSEEYSEVAAFDVGADDYINKPIRMRALLSRISAALRRGGVSRTDKSKIRVGDLVIDKSGYTVSRDGKQIFLPKKEFELLNFLAANPEKVFSRDELLQNIWGADVYVLARTVDVHVRKVREKIGREYIITVKGVGYKFHLPKP